MKRLTLILLLGLWPYMAITAHAADSSILPDKPQPQGKVHNEDREFWIEAGALGSAWTLDAISTHAAIAADPRSRETGLFFKGSRSTPKILGAWAAVDIAAAVVSYEWKNHVHNRYLHPLWRVPLLVGTAGHDYSAVENWSVGKGSVSPVTNPLPDSHTALDPPVRQIDPSPLRVPRKIGL